MIMRTIIILLIAICLHSCYKEAEIRVQNNISNAKILDVRWGDIIIDYELLPGQTSGKITIEEESNTIKLPSSNKVCFIMDVNNKSIYLETVEEYKLNYDDDKLIIIDNQTKVRNPNE